MDLCTFKRVQAGKIEMFYIHGKVLILQKFPLMRFARRGRAIGPVIARYFDWHSQQREMLETPLLPLYVHCDVQASRRFQFCWNVPFGQPGQLHMLTSHSPKFSRLAETSLNMGFAPVFLRLTIAGKLDTGT